MISFSVSPKTVLILGLPLVSLHSPKNSSHLILRNFLLQCPPPKEKGKHLFFRDKVNHESINSNKWQDIVFERFLLPIVQKKYL
jgi:hypothetical protein